MILSIFGYLVTRLLWGLVQWFLGLMIIIIRLFSWFGLSTPFVFLPSAYSNVFTWSSTISTGLQLHFKGDDCQFCSTGLVSPTRTFTDTDPVRSLACCSLEYRIFTLCNSRLFMRARFRDWILFVLFAIYDPWSWLLFCVCPRGSKIYLEGCKSCKFYVFVFHWIKVRGRILN